MSAVGVTAAAAVTALLLTGATDCSQHGTDKRHSFSCQNAQRASQEDPNDPMKQRDRREACT